ncbi:MAG: hypothetical protein P8Y63_16135 [Deltaproteobacteria bacterium]
MGTRRVSAHGRQRSCTSRLSGRWPLALICFFCGIFLRVPAGATLQGLHVGAAAPDLSLQNLAGQPRTLAELKGEKLTAVVFSTRALSPFMITGSSPFPPPWSSTPTEPSDMNFPAIP